MDDKARESKMAKLIKRESKIKHKVKELEIHSDKRGWLVEMLKRNELKEDIKQIYIASIKPGQIRGNHYHLNRTEWFFIMSGKARLCFEDFKNKERICLKLSAKKPKVITIFPKIAHAVKNIGKETVYLVSAQSDIYNPKNPDTLPYLIFK